MRLSLGDSRQTSAAQTGTSESNTDCELSFLDIFTRIREDCKSLRKLIKTGGLGALALEAIELSKADPRDLVAMRLVIQRATKIASNNRDIYHDSPSN